MNENIQKSIVKLMVTIVDRGSGQKVIDICRDGHIHFHFICLGHGTASSEVLDILGIGSTDKDMVLSLAPNFKIPSVLSALAKRMHLENPGKGIAFTVPLSGIGSLISHKLNQNIQNELEKEVKEVESNSKFSLILAAINAGYTEKLMTAAKEAGATGGTVVNARGISSEDAEKFLGISIQDEREIVAIITSSEAKQNIMQAINQQCGLKTDAKGVVFSVPVDNLVGLR